MYPVRMSTGVESDVYTWGEPGATTWSITRLARFSALMFASVPATVTGLVMPPRDIDIESTGTPARANSTWASSGPRLNTRGAVGHETTERIGRFRSSSRPPAPSGGGAAHIAPAPAAVT